MVLAEISDDFEGYARTTLPLLVVSSFTWAIIVPIWGFVDGDRGARELLFYWVATATLFFTLFLIPWASARFGPRWTLKLTELGLEEWRGGKCVKLHPRDRILGWYDSPGIGRVSYALFGGGVRKHGSNRFPGLAISVENGTRGIRQGLVIPLVRWKYRGGYRQFGNEMRALFGPPINGT